MMGLIFATLLALALGSLGLGVVSILLDKAFDTIFPKRERFDPPI
jgi:hypothetical protein